MWRILLSGGVRGERRLIGYGDSAEFRAEFPASPKAATGCLLRFKVQFSEPEGF